MKNNNKATKMQLAKKRSVKAPVSCLQTKKVSTELALLSKQLKGSLQYRIGVNRATARTAKKNMYYVGMDLGDKKSNYCFLDATGDIMQKEFWQRTRRN